MIDLAVESVHETTANSGSPLSLKVFSLLSYCIGWKSSTDLLYSTVLYVHHQIISSRFCCCKTNG